jgi:hypothetical protein
MAGGTLLAACSFLAAVRIQPLLDAAVRDKASATGPGPAAGTESALADSAS